MEIAARQHDNGIDALILVAGHEIVVRESTIIECLKADDVRASNDQNLWMALGGWTWWSAPSRG